MVQLLAPVIQTGNAGGDVADILANTNESGYVRSPVITNLENGGYVTTWEADNSLYAQIFNANGVAQHLDESGTPIDIKVSINTSGASSLTTIGLPNGDFVVTWIGYDSSLGDNVVFTQVFDQDGNAQNVDESGNQVDIRVSTDIGKSAYDQSMTELSDGGYMGSVPTCRYC